MFYHLKQNILKGLIAGTEMGSVKLVRMFVEYRKIPNISPPLNKSHHKSHPIN